MGASDDVLGVSVALLAEGFAILTYGFAAIGRCKALEKLYISSSELEFLPECERQSE